MRTIKKVLPRSKRNRFLLFFLGSGLLGLGLSFYDHNRYWKGTIKAVQTTELNILSHNLPTKLSLLVKNQDTEEINKVLDSAYGFIGLVITNCQSLAPECDEKILYKTNMDEGWGKNLSSQSLNEFPYDPLFNPVPLKTEGSYDHPYDHQRNPTGETNQGEIIGRVYYIRSIPPTFWEGLVSWGSQLITMEILGFLIHPYTFNFTIFLVGGFISWRFMERELYQIESINSTQRKQAQAEITRLQQKNQSLERETENLRHQITNLKQEREEQEAQVRQQEDLIAQQNEEVRREREQLNQKEISLQSLKETNVTTQEELNTLEQEIDSLRRNLTEREDTLEKQKLRLRQIQQSLEKAQNQEKRLKQLLKEKEQKEQTQRNQLEELRRQQEQQQQDIKEWADLAEEAWQEREQLKEKLEEQQVQIEEYELQILNYEDEINDRIEQLNQLYQYQGQDNSLLNQSQSNEEPWSICYTDTFAEWWQKLDSTTHDRLLRIIMLLEREGVTLGFPYSSDVKGTQHSRIRELRVGQADPYRIFYAFDCNQVPILLIGGNKTGEDDQHWYRKYGTLADEEYNKHLDNLEKNGHQVYKNLGNLL